MWEAENGLKYGYQPYIQFTDQGGCVQRHQLLAFFSNWWGAEKSAAGSQMWWKLRRSAHSFRRFPRAKAGERFLAATSPPPPAKELSSQGRSRRRRWQACPGWSATRWRRSSGAECAPSCATLHLPPATSSKSPQSTHWLECLHILLTFSYSLFIHELTVVLRIWSRSHQEGKICKNHPAYNAPEKMKLLELSRVLRQQGLPPAYMGKGGGAIGHGSE